MLKTKYKFLIISSNATSYYSRMVDGLARAFQSLGFTAATIKHSVTDKFLIDLSNSQNFNVVIQINGIKSKLGFPKHIRYISWIQDVFIETNAKINDSAMSDGDILYTLGDPKLIGLKLPSNFRSSVLFTGVSPQSIAYQKRNDREIIDFSLCGYIPSKLNVSDNLKKMTFWHLDRLVASLPFIGNISIVQSTYLNSAAIIKMSDYVSMAYKPLTGSLDITELEKGLRSITNNYSDLRRINNRFKVPHLFDQVLEDYRYILKYFDISKLTKFQKACLEEKNTSAYERAVNYFSQSYPRFLDRVTLLELALGVSSSIEIYGPDSWLSFPEFAKYYKGEILQSTDLLDVYLRSKINLSNNTHGLGLHSRVLECMAVGGFIFNHESLNDHVAGGMLTEFEPNVHFGQYSIFNFDDEAKKWLQDDHRRMQIGENARKLISEKHLWRHRAKKIINDLSE